MRLLIYFLTLPLLAQTPQAVRVVVRPLQAKVKSEALPLPPFQQDLGDFLAKAGGPAAGGLEISAVSERAPDGLCTGFILMNLSGAEETSALHVAAVQRNAADLDQALRWRSRAMAATLMRLPKAAQEAVPAEPPHVGIDRIKVRFQPPMPPFPAAAKAADITHAVIPVEITLDADGAPTGAVALDGPAQLQGYAARWALDWTFEPVQIDGAPRAVRITLKMVFNYHHA